MKIHAFTGIRYVDTGEAGELAAPPFDQINETLRQRFHSASPHHFSHLTRPDPAAEDQHQHAREIHERWLAEGVIHQDADPSLYPYEIDEGDGRRRLGVIALVGVDPSCDGDLRPHEHTVDKPLADRLALLEAMAVDLEPVFYLADDPDAALEAALREDCAGEHLVEHLDANGTAHRLYRVVDPERIAWYQKTLAPHSAAIADGHHRTKVAQMFARKHDAEPGTAPACKLAVITSLASQGLRIDPIHRGVRHQFDADALQDLAVTRSPFSGTTGADFAAAVREAEQPTLGVWLEGGSPELWRLDAEAVAADTPGRKAGLPVVLLQYQLLASAGLDLSAASDGTLQYRSDPDELWQMRADGEIPAAFFLPPMSPEAFGVATEDGDVLPPKSTRFLPKQISGLVWSAHTATVD